MEKKGDRSNFLNPLYPRSSTPGSKDPSGSVDPGVGPRECVSGRAATKKESIIPFPCFFPIKIIGKNTNEFQNDVTNIIFSHFPGVPEPELRCKQSNKSNYIAITATVYVHDQKSLDSLYQELNKHPEMKMVL